MATGTVKWFNDAKGYGARRRRSKRQHGVLLAQRPSDRGTTQTSSVYSTRLQPSTQPPAPRRQRVQLARGRRPGPRGVVEGACPRGAPATRPAHPGARRSNPPFYKWFADGILNVSVNCRTPPPGGSRRRPQDRLHLGRRARRGRAHDQLPRAARRRAPLRGRAQEPRRAARRPRRDLPHTVPELPVAMLACARIGAAHSVVFGGFSS